MQVSASGAAALLLAAARSRAIDHAPTTVVALLVFLGLARFAITRFPTDFDGSGAHGDRADPHPARGDRLRLDRGRRRQGAGLGARRRRPGRAPRHAPGARLGRGRDEHRHRRRDLARRRPLAPWFGLIERIFYVAMVAWFAVVAAYLL
jgi:hypothetical protein